MILNVDVYEEYQALTYDSPMIYFRIHFRNPVFNGGYSESNLRNVPMSQNFYSPTSPTMVLPNIYENVVSYYYKFHWSGWGT